MVPWMQIYSNLPNHSKTYLLAQTLNLSNVQTVGILICIWSWVSINTPDGNLSKYPNPRKVIEEITMWKNKKIDIYQSLIDTKWLDIIDGQCVIHDWNDYSAAGFKLKKQNAERQQRYRDKNKNNVTDNVTSRSTVHDSTEQLQNNTLQLSPSEYDPQTAENELIEREKIYWCKIMKLDDSESIPKQAYQAIKQAVTGKIDMGLIERIIDVSASKVIPAAWFSIVVDNLINDGIMTNDQYDKRYAGINIKQTESDGGSFDTEEFFGLALKRTYEEMENKNHLRSDASD